MVSRTLLTTSYLTKSFWLRSARETIYALASPPFGVLWFSVVVTLLATSAGLAITIVGLPLLLVTLGLVRLAAALERAWAELVLGERLPPASSSSRSARSRSTSAGSSRSCTSRPTTITIAACSPSSPG
jgi:hypothetical protein